MIEEFVQIPGPTFLILFGGLVTVAIAICWLWMRADGSEDYQLPDLTRFDSISIAQLRGGKRLIMQTAIFQLYGHELISFGGEGKDADITIPHQKGNTSQLSGAVEREIYRSLRSGTRKVSEICLDSGLWDRITTHLDPVQSELERLHLARTKSDSRRVWTITAVACLIIIGVGGTKLLLGILRDRPVLFLIILLIASVIAVFVILDPSSNPTSLGRRYLKETEKHFGWLKKLVKNGQMLEGIDPSLVIAIFGVGVLAGSTLYRPYQGVFSPVNQQGGGCGGGGCGGGCGGCGG